MAERPRREAPAGEAEAKIRDQVSKDRSGKDGSKDKDKEHHAEPFHNEPSSLDPSTHRELRLMHQEASAAVLFAKSIQWSSVGAALLVDGAIVAIAVLTGAGKVFSDILVISSVLLAAGAVFVLLMYQFWQINEINRMNEIEKHFSTLYGRIARLKSRREGNVHRYTLLFFMMVMVIIGTVVANVGIQQALNAAPK